MRVRDTTLQHWGAAALLDVEVAIFVGAIGHRHQEMR